MNMRTFLLEIIGPSGLKAIEPLLKSESEVGGFVLEKSASSFLRTLRQGQEYSCTQFVISKSEEGFSGVANINEVDYVFSNADEAHSVAVICKALQGPAISLAGGAGPLHKLGLTLAALVKAQTKAGAAGTGVSAGAIPATAATPATNIAPKAGPGASAKPAAKTPKLPSVKPPAAPEKTKLKLSEKEASKACPTCGKSQVQKSEFTGCACLADLSKLVKATKVDGGFALELQWSPEDVYVLLKNVGKAS